MPRIRPPNTPRGSRRPPPQLAFCNCCAGRFVKITRMMPPGYCARCGERGTPRHPTNIICTIPDVPSQRFEIHLECEAPWFAKDGALSPETVARLFLQPRKIRALRPPTPPDLPVYGKPHSVPPDDAA
jgi:hypothetical protein